MAEKLKLNEFLMELTKLINKRLDSFENEISLVRSEIKRLETNQRKEELQQLKQKIDKIENTLATSRDLNLVDRSILKMLENEENVRRN